MIQARNLVVEVNDRFKMNENDFNNNNESNNKQVDAIDRTVALWFTVSQLKSWVLCLQS